MDENRSPEFFSPSSTSVALGEIPNVLHVAVVPRDLRASCSLCSPASQKQIPNPCRKIPFSSSACKYASRKSESVEHDVVEGFAQLYFNYGYDSREDPKYRILWTSTLSSKGTGA
ncbi:unnamed protein product [Amoebophrya sp. A120]|nr:unnamed protein product [Amoebophrya sp. A120]|eukprot:GSA120T00026005001.1